MKVNENVRLMICLVAAGSLSAACAGHRVATGSGVDAHHRPTLSKASLNPTLESSDQRLRAALLQLAVVPSAASQRGVAIEYRRLGVLDEAHEHFSDAVKRDPTDAVSYDALARLWRDWGVAKMALPDARRAVRYAPRSASAANTLGTVLQALGEFAEAKRWYARALALDASAWYAINNMCYAELLTKDPYAVTTCERAVAAAPDAAAPQNNLALAHAAAGDLDGAQQWFRRAGDVAVAHYNYGILMMSTRDYKKAEEAFHAALLADPESTLAASRARQARLAADAEEQTRDRN
jgi:tetratricopeptide (TPR) repeat protein